MICTRSPFVDCSTRPGKIRPSATASRSLLACQHPLDPHSYFHGRLVNPKDAAESQSLTLEKGWKLVPDWAPADGAGTRPGFVNVPTLVAEEAGATFKFRFKGTAVGLFVASGPDTGRVDFRVDDGDWKSEELYTQWSSFLHLPWAKMLASELAAGDHVLELKVDDAADSKSKGHAIRIVYLLVN